MGPLHALDEACFRAIYAGPSGGAWGTVMLGLTVLGSGWSMLALLPFLAVPRTRGFAGSLAATLVVTAAIVFGLKIAVRRARPCATLDGVTAAVRPPTDFSFPSGHAAGSFAFAAFVATALVARSSATPWGERRPGSPLAAFTAALVLALAAAGIAISRVYLGVHYPGDVLGGALVGASMGVLGGRTYTSAGAR